MFGIEHDFLAALLEEGNRLPDHAQVFVERGAQDRRGVVIPGFAKDRHRGRVGTEQGGELLVVLGPGADLAGAAKSDDAGIPERDLAEAVEEFQVFRVRSGIAGFDVGDAQLIKLPYDLELVFHREGDALRLRAVSQGGVVGEYLIHGLLLCREFCVPAGTRLSRGEA
jgi:hypothetical protein